MSEHTGLEFAPQSPRSQNSPSMPPLVLFIISMFAIACHEYCEYANAFRHLLYFATFSALKPVSSINTGTITSGKIPMFG